MADLTAVADMLKEVWPSSFETAFSNEIVALSRIERTTDGVSNDISGRYTVIPMKVSRNQGIGSRPERGVLPAPGEQGWEAARVELAHQYGVGEITSQALLLADREPRSFINTLDEELSGLRDDVMKDYSRMVYGDGSGTLGTIQSVDSATVVTVDTTQYFEVGMILDSVTTGGPTVTAQGAEVTAVDTSAKTVTFDSTAGMLTSDVLVRTGNYNQEINGLQALLDSNHATTSFQNLTSNTEPTWAPDIRSPGAHAYSEIEIGTRLDENRRRTGKRTTAMFTDFGVRRAVFAHLDDDRQFHNTIEFGQGFAAMPFTWGGQTIPMVEDPDFPTDFDASTGAIYGINEPTVKVYREESGWHFAEETGSMFIPSFDRRDAWEFRLRQFSQMGYSQRNCHWLIDGINTVSS